jgi:hypothetical protein
MIDKKLGEKYQHIICKECQNKVREETKKLSKIDLLFPKKIMRKFKTILCSDCEKKLVKEMQKYDR